MTAIRLEIGSVFGIDIICNLSAGGYMPIESRKLNLSRECRQKLQAVMDYHNEFLSVNEIERRGSVEEKKHFWRLMDEAVEQLERELDPQRYVVYVTIPPEPDPFEDV